MQMPFLVPISEESRVGCKRYFVVIVFKCIFVCNTVQCHTSCFKNTCDCVPGLFMRNEKIILSMTGIRDSILNR